MSSCHISMKLAEVEETKFFKMVGEISPAHITLVVTGKFIENYIIKIGK